MNFYYLQQVNTTYRIGTNSYPKYYLTWEWANKKLYFRSKMASSQYQKFAIKSYSYTSGMSNTIHAGSKSSWLVRSGVIKSDGSEKHIAYLYSKSSEESYSGMDWKLDVDKEGVFKLINTESFIYEPSETGGYGTFTYRAIERGQDGLAELNGEAETGAPNASKQRFTIEALQPVSISGVEYLDERDLSGDVVSVKKMSDYIYRESFENTGNRVKNVVIDFNEISLQEQSNFQEYKGIKFDITNLDSVLLWTPRVHDGKLQKAPDDDYSRTSLYRSYQTVVRHHQGIAFSIEVPSGTRATVSFPIPRYQVRCPYKLHLSVNSNQDISLTAYGYWSGIVHSFSDEVDLDLTIEALDNVSSSRPHERKYRIPRKLLKSGHTIKESDLRDYKVL